ncbi:MAG: TetR/AcrR family transcriptional regulator C-terminal domain-containing protein [Clostridiales Family XIII bacterium]|jgi:AcrR family transcriptional regulator|nr:TetR/AcrR family transcriptional regulator C-terminal domain-containing protein [Clostridiales Family XIII bacterium]
MAIDVKKMLSDALINICDEKPLAKATVQDIVRKAGTSRQTFYNHFRDKNDLISWTYFTRITGDMRAIDGDCGLYGFVYDAHRYCVEHKRFFMQACALQGQNSLREYMLRHNYENYLNLIIEKHGEGVLTDELLWAIEFNACGAICMHLKWVQDGMTLAPETKARYVVDCIPEILRRYLPVGPTDAG